jgi:hypothetical protein
MESNPKVAIAVLNEFKAHNTRTREYSGLYHLERVAWGQERLGKTLQQLKQHLDRAHCKSTDYKASSKSV